MANDLHTAVPKITVTDGRLNATVAIGTTRYGVVLDPRRQDLGDVFAAVNTLRDALIKHVKSEMVSHLEDDLAPSARSALTT